MAGKVFILDYVQRASGVLVSNTTAGVSEIIESVAYDSGQVPAIDHVVNVDLTPGTYSETRVLDVDNGHASPYSGTFSDTENPSGTELDFFRFSVTRSLSTWTLDSRGRALTRLYWDFGNDRSISTGYYDAHSTIRLMRVHQFANHVHESRAVQVALELMRPDEAPDDTTNVTVRTISIAYSGGPISAAFIVNGDTSPDLITQTGIYRYVVRASGGLPPLTHQWHYHSLSTDSVVGGNDSSYTRSITVHRSDSYVFRLIDSLADSHTPVQRSRAIYFVEVVGGGGGRAITGNLGVRLQDGSCGQRPASGQLRQAWLRWVFEYAGAEEICAIAG